MNCHDVEPFFERLANAASCADLPQQPALRDHLATCPSCQHAVQSLMQWDRRLATAMKDVSVPTGIAQRIQLALHHGSDTVTSVPAMTGRSRGRSGWRLVAVLSSLGVFAAVVIGLLAWSQPSTISADQVVVMLQQPVAEMPELNPASIWQPRHWNALQRDMADGGWRQFSMAELKPAIAALPFEIRIKRAVHAEGVLFAIPKSRWTTPVAPSISQAVVLYSPPHVWLAWSEDDVVFLLAVNGPAPVLEQMQRQLSGGRAVF